MRLGRAFAQEFWRHTGPYPDTYFFAALILGSCDLQDAREVESYAYRRRRVPHRGIISATAPAPALAAAAEAQAAAASIKAKAIRSMNIGDGGRRRAAARAIPCI